MAAAKKQKVNKETVPAKKEDIKKARKPYPSKDERMAMIDKKIARLENLNADRKALIEKTEKKLDERKTALGKSEKMLATALSYKEKLAAPKPEKKASPRKAGAAEKARIAELAEALKASGKTIDEVLQSLK